MGKNLSLFLLILSVFLIGLFYFKAFEIVRIKNDGVLMTANIARPPHCSGKSRIYIDVNNKTYPIQVGKNQCSSGDYAMGKKVEVIFHAEIDDLILAETNPKPMLYIGLALFFIPLYLFYFYRKKAT